MRGVYYKILGTLFVILGVIYIFLSYGGSEGLFVGRGYFLSFLYFVVGILEWMIGFGKLEENQITKIFSYVLLYSFLSGVIFLFIPERMFDDDISSVIIFVIIITFISTGTIISLFSILFILIFGRFRKPESNFKEQKQKSLSEDSFVRPEPKKSLVKQDSRKFNYYKILGTLLIILGIATIFILRYPRYGYLPLEGFLLLFSGMMMLFIGLTKQEENQAMKITRILLAIYVPINAVFLLIVFFKCGINGCEGAFGLMPYQDYFDHYLSGIWSTIWNLFQYLYDIILWVVLIFLIASIWRAFKEVVYNEESGYKFLGILLILFGIISFVSFSITHGNEFKEVAQEPLSVDLGWLLALFPFTPFIPFILAPLYFILGVIALLVHLDILRKNLLTGIFKIVLLVSFLSGLLLLLVIVSSAGFQDGLSYIILFIVFPLGVISLIGVLISFFVMLISGIYCNIKYKPREFNLKFLKWVVIGFVSIVVIVIIVLVSAQLYSQRVEGNVEKGITVKEEIFPIKYDLLFPTGSKTDLCFSHDGELLLKRVIVENNLSVSSKIKMPQKIICFYPREMCSDLSVIMYIDGIEATQYNEKRLSYENDFLKILGNSKRFIEFRMKNPGGLTDVDMNFIEKNIPRYEEIKENPEIAESVQKNATRIPVDNEYLYLIDVPIDYPYGLDCYDITSSDIQNATKIPIRK